MPLRRFALCFLAIPLLLAGQDAKPTVTITGAVKTPLTLTAADLAAMPRSTAPLKHEHDGMTTTYEGVALQEVLKRAGAPLGADLRGKALSAYIVATASDGYQVVLSLGEIDPDMSGNHVLLADRSDGKPLFGEDGSFRLVLPGDKRGARCIRMVTKIEVVQLRK